MKNNVLKRLLSLALAVMMVASVLPVGALAATSEVPTGGWNNDYTVVDAHGSELSTLKDYAAQIGNAKQPVTDVVIEYKYFSLKEWKDVTGTHTVENVTWNSVKNTLRYNITPGSIEHNATYSATAEFDYSVNLPGIGKVSGVGTFNLGSFTLKIFDIVTVETTIGGVTTTTYEKVYRGETVEIPVEDKSAENYVVEVSGASQGENGKYYVSGLTSDAEVSVTYTLDTDSYIDVDSDDGVVVSVPKTAHADSEVTVTATPKENYYITNTSVTKGWTDSRYLNGTFIGKFMTGPAKEYITVNVGSALILEPTGANKIDFNRYMSAAELKAEIFEKLIKAAPGITVDDVVVKFQDLTLSGYNWVVLSDSTLSNFAFELIELDEETVRIEYDGDGDGGRYSNAVSSDFTVTFEDNRPVPTVNVKDDVSTDIFPMNTDGSECITEDEAFELIFDSVTYGDSVVDASGNVYSYDVTIKQDNEAISSITEAGEYTVEVIFPGDKTYKSASASTTLTVIDGREKTQIKLKNENVSVVFKNAEYTAEEIYALVFGSLQDADGNILTLGENLDGTVDVKMPDDGIKNVGTYTVTIIYSGDRNYQGSEATVKVDVTKAKASVSVDSFTKKYDGEDHNAENQITVSPSIDYISFAVGLSAGENASANVIAYVDLPQIIPESLLNLISGVNNETLNKLVAEGIEVKVADLSAVLGSINDGLELLESIASWTGADLGISTEAITTLTNVLNQIEGIEGVGELTVKLTMDSGISVKDSGVYLVGGVTADGNYETAYGLNYLIITPNGQKAELGWKYTDTNNIFTLDHLNNVDMGAEVVKIYEGDKAEAEKRIVTLFFGVDANGNVTQLLNGQPTAPGAYLEIAFIRDLGNEMYYAEPIIRSVIVVANHVDVKFIDENGNENNDRIFSYDGTPKAMKAIAYAKGTTNQLPDQENVTVRYIGVESDGDVYNSTGAPSATGVYTVLATYYNAEETKVGTAVGTMVIEPADASIEVTDKIHTYNGSAVDVVSMITKSPDDAKMVIVTAGIADMGDFSEQGLSAVKGNVNIDFPARVDDVLKNIPGLYTEDGIALSDFTAKLTQIKNALNAAGYSSSVLDEIVDQLNQMDDDVTLTFKDNVSYSNIGAYLVIAGIMDPDYKPAIDTGILMIIPEISDIELKWNYNDANGIITRPVLSLEGVDLLAKAYDENGKYDAENSAKIEYLLIGVDDNGNTVTMKGTEGYQNLPNGIYTQIAYIPVEVDATMTMGYPIMRQIVLTGQTVKVEVTDKTMTYTGNSGDAVVTVSVTDMAGKTITGDRLKNLTVTYLGLNGTEILYNSETAPTDAGVYTVIAEYVEYDANGNLLYFGADVGTLVIKPAETKVVVKSDEVFYDGKEHLPEITVTPNTLSLITIVVDEDNNVNILLPDSWKVPLTAINVEGGITNILNQLENLDIPEEYADAAAKLKEVLSGIEIKTLTINGVKPVEVGTYKITAIAFGDSNHSIAKASGTLIIKEKAANCTDHDYEWKYDDNCHWQECTKCGNIINKQSHKLKWQSDADGHWQECKTDGCGYATKESEHTYAEKWTKCDGTYHEHTCKVCGHTETEKHTFGDWIIVTKAGKYVSGLKYRVCEKCGAKETAKIPATHSPTTGDTSNVQIVAIVGLLAAAAVVILLVIYRKRNKK